MILPRGGILQLARGFLESSGRVGQAGASLSTYRGRIASRKPGLVRHPHSTGSKIIHAGEMKTFIQSLSLTSGAGLLAIVSAAVVWVLCYVFPLSLRKLWIVIVPLILSYCLYWSPVWFFGEPSQEYHTWMILFLVSWSLPGWLSGFFSKSIAAKASDRSAPADGL